MWLFLTWLNRNVRHGATKSEQSVSGIEMTSLLSTDRQNNGINDTVNDKVTTCPLPLGRIARLLAPLRLYKLDCWRLGEADTKLKSARIASLNTMGCKVMLPLLGCRFGTPTRVKLPTSGKSAPMSARSYSLPIPLISCWRLEMILSVIFCWCTLLHGTERRSVLLLEHQTNHSANSFIYLLTI